MRIKFCCFRTAKPEPENSNSGEPASDGNAGASFMSLNSIPMFSYNHLKSATRNFSPTSKIGRGGFGIVYKGILRDGTQAAIKSLSTESKQGVHEFLTEIETLSNIRHPNLVRLIGCCVQGTERLLVYEYVENNCLANALFGPYNKQTVLEWPQRAAICIGTAHGLAFLHEEAVPPIVHRDIKASNVLLDKNFQPKIGDFGLAKLFPDTVTHISTRVAGTMGYLAPEYALHGQLTKKADIFSFGVLILEIISGRSSGRALFGLDMKYLLEWAWQLRNEDRLLDLVDSDLVEYPEDDILRFIKVALFCTQALPHQRPNMLQVVEMLQLSELLLDVKALRKPGVVTDINRSFGMAKKSKSPLVQNESQSSSYGFATTFEDPGSAPQTSSEMQPR